MIADPSKKSKFLFVSEFGELLDLALYLKNVEGQEVLFHVPDKNYTKISEGMFEKTDDSWVSMGQGYIWVFDGCTRGKRQDWLRSQGELVIGGTEVSDKLENDRQAGQRWFKQAGFKEVESHNFKSIEDGIKFIENNKDRRWILKQNGDAPKSMNHMGKFPGSEDMLYHLDDLKKKWNEAEMGPVDFDLMEVVEGLELACSAFFNGKNFLKNKEGKVVGFLNFEEKKECDGGLGETTGEMGTTFIGVDETNSLFKEIMMRPKIAEILRKINYRGVFDINCIKTKDGIVALEATSRFGVPATSYEFIEGLDMPSHELLSIIARGENKPISIKMGVGMVMVVAAKPFPVESNEGSSIGEKLWILENGNPIKDLTDEQRKHIHLENFYKDGEDYKVATTNGYLLTVTGKGETIEDTREELIKYIKDNLYISGMKYRTDIGKRVEESSMGTVKERRAKLDAEYAKKVEEVQTKKQQEVKSIKDALHKALYG